MAGLLDGFGEFIKTPEGQGLLAATFGGLAGARQGQPLNSLGRAGLAGISGYGGALDRSSKLAEEAQLNQYRAAQMSNMQAETDSRKQAMSLDALKRSSLPSLFTGGRSATSPMSGDTSTGIIESAGSPAVAPSFDIARAVSSGLFTPQEIEAWAKVPNSGMTEVARTMKGMQNGKEVDQQFDKYGRPVGSGLEQYKAPLMQDLGGNVSALDPYTLKPQAVLPKTMTFGDKTAIGNLAVSQQRLKMEQGNQNQPVFNESLGGFVVKPNAANPDGKLIPLAGGSVNPKMTEDQAKASGWLVQAENSFGNMKGAMTRTPSASKPGFNDALGSVPGLGGFANSMRGADRQQFIQGSSSLSEALLRAATGAGVNKDEARQKIEELTPIFGEDEKTTKQKMDAIPLYIESLKMRAGPGAKKADLIGTSGKQTSNSPMRGQIVDGHKFKGGNPADPASWEKQ